MFKNKKEAANILAEELDEKIKQEADFVSAATFDSLDTAEILADKLGLPVNHVISTKLFVPGKRDLVFGAVSADGTIWLHDGMVNGFLIDREFIEDYAKQRKEVLQQEIEERGIENDRDIRSKNMLMVADGISSGMRMGASLGSCIKRNIGTTYVASPFVSQHGERRLRDVADEIFCVERPKFVASVREGYSSYEKTLI